MSLIPQKDARCLQGIQFFDPRLPGNNVSFWKWMFLFCVESQTPWRSVKELSVWRPLKACWSTFTPHTLAQQKPILTFARVTQTHTCTCAHTYSYTHVQAQTHTHTRTPHSHTENLINIPPALVSVLSDSSSMLSVLYESHCIEPECHGKLSL